MSENNNQEKSIQDKIPSSLHDKFNINPAQGNEEVVVQAPNTSDAVITQPDIEVEEHITNVDLDSKLDTMINSNETSKIETVAATVKVKSYNPLDNIVVDLNNLEFVEKTAFNQQDDYDELFNKKSVFDVVACQSAYSASMSAFNMNDINSITNSNVDRYKSRQRMYKAVYNHIEAMSIPKPGFNEWLSITSFGDWDTLLFGIYAQTFPEDNDFDIKCGHCGKETPVTIDNNTLITVKDEKVYGKIKEVVSGLKDPAMLVNNSQVHKYERVMLKDSKCVVEIQTPSLYDYLSLIKNTDEKVLENYAETVSIMMFIKNFYILDVAATKATGKARFSPISTTGTEMLNTLTKLSVVDGKQLEKAIEARIEKFAINYSINNATCNHCKDTLEPIAVDLETLLFTRINKDQQ